MSWGEGLSLQGVAPGTAREAGSSGPSLGPRGIKGRILAGEPLASPDGDMPRSKADVGHTLQTPWSCSRWSMRAASEKAAAAVVVGGGRLREMARGC